MEETMSFTPLLLVISLAFIIPFILTRFKRLRLPIVVGEIIAGMIIGRSGFNLVNGHDPMLDVLSRLGFVFLMFLSGLEIDFSGLGLLGRRGNRPKRQGAPQPPKGLGASLRAMGPVQIGGVSFILALLLAQAAGFAFYAAHMVLNPWLMALIFSTTSLGVVVPVLKERGLSQTQFGQSLLIAALIADFATMLLITIEVSIFTRGLTLDVLLISVLFVVFIVFYLLGQRILYRIPGLRNVFEELSHATAQIKIRAAFTIMLFFMVISEALGTEIILGAFLAGAILSLFRSSEDARLTHQLEAVGFGFLIPIFFIMVGVDFNLGVLMASSQALLLAPLLFLAAVAIKILAALVFKARFSWRQTFSAGALLSARLSLIIAASAIGLRLGAISEATNSAIILVAIITVTLAPVIFLRLAPTKDEHEHPMLVAGAGDLGIRVAEQLKAHHSLVVVLDPDPERAGRARKHGFQVVEALPQDPTPEAAGLLEDARALVCTYQDIDIAFQVCQAAHSRFGVRHIVAQVNEPAELPRFRALGVKTMNAAIDRASLLSMMVRNPAVYDLLTLTDDSKVVEEMEIGSQGCAGQLLRQIPLPGDVLILAVRRNGELLIPHGNTRLEEGDHLTLAGAEEHVRASRAVVSG